MPIERIDHITLAQPFDAFDEAGLFYRRVLDAGADATRRSCAAPDGLVRSRAFADRRRARRAQRARAARAPGDRTELQHVAFSCADALAAARRDARARRPAARRARRTTTTTWRRGSRSTPRTLRELGVLYDRTPEGELLHFYTARLGGRVFFEVLERRGDYAATAPRIRPSAWQRKPEERDMQNVLEADPVKTGRFAREGGSEERQLPDAPPLRKLLGPSVILVGVGVASGEYILFPYIASQAGLVFLWAAIVGVAVQFFINMEIERYTLATGETAIGCFQRLWGRGARSSPSARSSRRCGPGWATSAATVGTFADRRRRSEPDRDRRAAGDRRDPDRVARWSTTRSRSSSS